MSYYHKKTFTSEQKQAIREKEFLTIDECAEYLGLHPQTIYQWGRDGKIVFSRCGRSIKIRKSDANNVFQPQTTPQQALRKSANVLAKGGLKLRTN